MNILSLFANIGVAEARLKETDHKVVLANELEKKRCEIYHEIYSDHEIIQGDIFKEETQKEIIEKAKELDIDIIQATPPCQGMSLVSKGYKNKMYERKQMQKMEDPRNLLTVPTIKLIKEIKPKYVFIENVIQYLKTGIVVDNEVYTIEDYIDKELAEEYKINKYKINTKDYGVPQSRRRQILLMTRKDLLPEGEWVMPKGDTIDNPVSLEQAIGDLPSLDPYIKDATDEERKELTPDYEKMKEEGLKVHPWHYANAMPKRHFESMRHTETGHSAFESDIYYPKKENGDKVSGFSSTYKRQSWDKPASTLTMGNSSIGGCENGHPGRFIGYENNDNTKPLYSDARVLTPYEVLLISSLPTDWVDFKSFKYSGETIRKYIGEGIPPLFVKKVYDNIPKLDK